MIAMNTTGGHKIALEEAVAIARAEEAACGPAQTDLFGGPNGSASGQPVLPVPSSDGSRRMGRPPGSRNLRTDQAARWYMQRHGDPLERGIAVASLPVLAKGVLDGLAERLGCTRHEAAKWWASVYSATLPFVHQRLATLTVKPEGAPGGEPVRWTFSEEFVDVSSNGFDGGQGLVESELLLDDDNR